MAEKKKKKVDLYIGIGAAVLLLIVLGVMAMRKNAQAQQTAAGGAAVPQPGSTGNAVSDAINAARRAEINDQLFKLRNALGVYRTSGNETMINNTQGQITALEKELANIS